jgi:hypothetical protein
MVVYACNHSTPEARDQPGLHSETLCPLPGSGGDNKEGKEKQESSFPGTIGSLAEGSTEDILRWLNFQTSSIRVLQSSVLR